MLSCLPIRGLEVLKLARIVRQTDQALLSVVPEIERLVCECKSWWSVPERHAPNDKEAAHDPVGRNGIAGNGRGAAFHLFKGNFLKKENKVRNRLEIGLIALVLLLAMPVFAQNSGIISG